MHTEPARADPSGTGLSQMFPKDDLGVEGLSLVGHPVSLSAGTTDTSGAPHAFHACRRHGF